MKRAGIVGTGGVAGLGLLGTDEDVGRERSMASHAGGYHRTKGIELVAIADPDEDKRATFGEAWEIPEHQRHDDHHALLEAEELDLVSVCTPTMLHHQHVVDVARSDTPPEAIWCEKPIASSLEQAHEMIDACEEAGVTLVVNHSFRFVEKFVRLRELLDQGRLLGDVRAVHANFRMELMRNSTHLLDTIFYLLDKEPARASGHLTGENEALDALGASSREVDDVGGGGFLVFDDGAFASVDCTVPRDLSAMNFELLGTGGRLYLGNDDGTWRYWALEDGDHREEELPGIAGAFSWEEDYEHSFANAARHVLEVLEGKAENRSSGVEASRSLEVIVAFYASHHTGGHVPLPLPETFHGITIRSW